MSRIGEIRARVTVGVVLAAAVATGCAAPRPSPSPVPAADGLPLPSSGVAWPSPPASPPACAGVGLDAILHGNQADPAVTWLEDRAGGGRIAIKWPPGFRARFAPALEVIDLTGQVVHREGDAIDGGCIEGDDIVLGYP
jgi:hypothetical protein